MKPSLLSSLTIYYWLWNLSQPLRAGGLSQPVYSRECAMEKYLNALTYYNSWLTKNTIQTDQNVLIVKVDGFTQKMTAQEFVEPVDIERLLK